MKHLSTQRLEDCVAWRIVDAQWELVEQSQRETVLFVEQGPEEASVFVDGTC